MPSHSSSRNLVQNGEAVQSLSCGVIVVSGGRTQRALQSTARSASPQGCTDDRTLHHRAEGENVRGGTAPSANEGAANIRRC